MLQDAADEGGGQLNGSPACGCGHPATVYHPPEFPVVGFAEILIVANGLLIPIQRCGVKLFAPRCLVGALVRTSLPGALVS